MTTPLSLLQRAKQGDARAIAMLMNAVLESQNIWVKASLDSDGLQVMLKAPTVLHQDHCIAFIRRGLLRLQPETINRVTTYAWRVGDAFPLWIAAFSLEPTLLSQCRLHSQAGVLGRSSSDCASVESDSETLANETPVTWQSAALSTLPPNASRQYSELFKLGVVIVLTTAVYLMVTGV